MRPLLNFSDPIARTRKEFARQSSEIESNGKNNNVDVTRIFACFHKTHCRFERRLF